MPHPSRSPLRWLVAIVLLLCAFGASAGQAQRWRLDDLYPTVAAWNAARGELATRIDALPKLKDGIGDSAATLLQALTTISDVRRTMGRVYVYASLNADEDLRNAAALERQQQAESLYTRLGEASSWLAPTIVAIGESRIAAFIAAEPALRSRFDRELGEILRGAAHTLTPEGEGLLAASGLVLAQPANIFDQIAEAELPRPTVTLSDGRRVVLSNDAYELHRQSPVRADRQRVFDAFFGAWRKVEGTLGANLTTQVMGDVYMARARRHANSLDAALFGDNMPASVYRTLVEQAHAGLPTLHRYLALRRRTLGIAGPLAYFDNYPPLVAAPRGMAFDLERSKAVTLAALAPMGDEYLSLLKRGFDAPWTDSHPRPGKKSGAYVAGWAYDVHPYVLLNHGDDFASLSTLAHEWGHAVHTMLAGANQPFEKASYSTFIAESASIANEMLLSDHLIASARSRQEKMFYLSQAMESIRTTFFRQVMFAEFQLAMHEEVEAGRPLSGRRLTQMYCSLVERYYGAATRVMKIDPAYCIEWAYVPHFYKGYYVWQYATSMVGAAEFTDRIVRDGAPARDRFIDLLKAGESDDAYRLYLKAGVDLAQPGPYRALFARMNRLIDEFEAQLARRTK